MRIESTISGWGRYGFLEGRRRYVPNRTSVPSQEVRLFRSELLFVRSELHRVNCRPAR
jgi:hypothetical protein